MSTTWTQTAAQVCRKALEHLNIVGAGESVSNEDQVTALLALDGLLKELPLVGYAWPQLSSEVALAWASSQTVTLPADYYGYPVVRKTVNNQDKRLTQIPHADWLNMPDRSVSAPEPTHFYIDPANVLHYWPFPAQDPIAFLQYQKLVDDASLTSAPNVPQYALMALPWGVADELSLDYGLGAQDRAEIRQRWLDKRQLLLESAIEPGIVEFGVAG